MRALVQAAPYAPVARAGGTIAEGLLRKCDRTGRLPDELQQHAVALLGVLEQSLG